jgi:hypothetical protein
MDSTSKSQLQTLLMTLALGAGGHKNVNPLFLCIAYVIMFNMEYIIDVVTQFLKRHIIKYGQMTYTLEASITFRHGLIGSNDVSPSFKAIILDVIDKLKRSKHNIKYDIEHNIYNYLGDTFPFIKFESTHEYFHVGNNIMVNVTKNEKMGSDSSMIVFNLLIRHVHNNMDACQKYVDECLDVFMSETENALKVPHVFLLTDIKEDKTTEPVFQKVRFDTSKTFDNLFFEAKDELLKRLDYFMNNEDKYRHLGMPHTLGLLFHGAPGTGKTSAIKAVANYTKRHIVCVSLKKIRTIEDLRAVFYNTKINDAVVPHKKRLYVFEEIDCGQWGKVIAKRSMGNDGGIVEPVQIPCVEENGMNDTKIVSRPKPKMKDDINITLGEILELLDGVIEIPGRMIIMTTNHPEKLDPALTRPGRIDMTIEFKKMNRSEVSQMYQLWFNERMPQHVFNNIKDYTYTQADLGYIFSKNDVQYAHKTLMSCKIKSIL